LKITDAVAPAQAKFYNVALPWNIPF